MNARFVLFYLSLLFILVCFFFFQAEDGIRDATVTGVQTCALPICTSTPAGAHPRREERTMPYDLVIKNGVLIDGSGLPRYHADVAVRHGRIAAIGKIRERAREVIDADGLVVTPGFIDGHTHMDAQIFWDPLGTCSCWHGVTTVVMGNCGFTLAPCAASDKHFVVRYLQRAAA